MKKLLLSLFVLITLNVFAQKDLQVFLDSPAVGQTITATHPFNIKYRLVNNGTVDIPATDSVVLGIAVNNSVVYAVALNHGGLTIGQSKSGALNGFSLNFNTSVPNANFCILATLRYNGNVDSNMNNNVACAVVNMVANTGINELSASTKVNIFPNPATDVIHIDYDYSKPSTIIIYDITGKQVETINVASGAATVDVNAYNKGLYLFEIISADNQKLKSGRFSVAK